MPRLGRGCSRRRNLGSWRGFVFGSAGRGQTGSNAQAFTGQPAGEGLRPSPHRDWLGLSGWAGRTQLGIRCDPPQVGEAQQREQEHDRGADECADPGDAGDPTHGAEGVGVEQQTAQGLTLEHCRDLPRQLGVVGGGLGLGAELGVGQAPADLLEMHSDEVVGIGLGLRTGEELLAGILVEERADLRAGRGRALRREEYLLLAELGVHLVADERARPGKQTPRGEQDGCRDEPETGEQGIESLASHRSRALPGPSSKMGGEWAGEASRRSVAESGWVVAVRLSAWVAQAAGWRVTVYPRASSSRMWLRFLRSGLMRES